MIEVNRSRRKKGVAIYPEKMPNGDYLIPLSNGTWTVISPEDADLAEYLWVAIGRGGTCVARHVGGQYVKMHQLIAARLFGSVSDGMEIDHINRNPMDNRRSNLRLATKSQNLQNRRGWGKHGRGISLSPNGKYRVEIQLGTFDTEEEANAAWEVAAKLLRGEFAFERGLHDRQFVA